MNIILTPSKINFLKESKDNPLIKPNQDLIDDLSKKFKDSIPKIQVSKKNGAWFALNNTLLYLIQELEKQGKCSAIQVEIVPLNKVPRSLQQGMITDEEEKKSERNSDAFFTNTINNLPKEKSSCSLDLIPNETISILEDDANSSSEYSDEDSESDEQLICNVCDKNFKSGKQLGQHQLKRKHFWCSLCDAIFPTLISLELHKKTLSHLTDDETTDDENGNEETVSYVKLCKEIEKLL